MSLLWTALARHLIAPITIYIASDDFRVHVSAAVAAAVAYGWSAIEKKVTDTDSIPVETHKRHK